MSPPSVIARITDTVTALPLNESPNVGGAVIAAGGSFVFVLENVTKTDALYNSVDDQPELAANTAWAVSGNLFSITVNTYAPLIQVFLDERWFPNAQWLRADQLLVTPGMPSPLREFRFSAHMLRVTLYNGGTLPAVVTWGTRVATS